MPAISVIMPVYQAAPFLRDSARSVLEQTFRDFELILVDDGSTDGSAALCDALAGEDSRVRVLHKKNGGVSAARNDGMDLAAGEYLYFCDADDAITPDALEKLHSALTEAGADTSGCGVRLVWPDGRTEDQPGALPPGTYGARELRERIVMPLLGERLDQGGGVLNGFVVRFLFSRSVIERRGLRFEGPYLEDEVFLMEYFLHAQKLATMDDALYLYLQNPGSATRRYQPKYVEVFRRVMERKGKIAKEHGLDAGAPGWEDNANWAGLLIAVGNEYAAGNPKSFREKSACLKRLCGEPDMAHALANLKPKGLAGNKQLVADLLMGRHFTLLGLLYTIKNRGR